MRYKFTNSNCALLKMQICWVIRRSTFIILTRGIVFDVDNSGVITKDNLKRVLEQLGEKLNDEDVEEMVKEADLNGDGMIDYKGIFGNIHIQLSSFYILRNYVTNCTCKSDNSTL